jgi:hypothetical protein
MEISLVNALKTWLSGSVCWLSEIRLKAKLVCMLIKDSMVLLRHKYRQVLVCFSFSLPTLQGISSLLSSLIRTSFLPGYAYHLYIFDALSHLHARSNSSLNTILLVENRHSTWSLNANRVRFTSARIPSRLVPPTTPSSAVRQFGIHASDGGDTYGPEAKRTWSRARNGMLL